MEPVNTVVVGYGMAGRQFHSYLVGLTPGLRLHGIVSGSEEKRERIVAGHGCKAYAHIDEALGDPQVELVVIATPNSTHAELSIAALNGGKHVVTDKVMCLSLADCDRMLEAAKNNDRMLAVFQNRRFDGDYLTVRKLKEEGQLGDVRWTEMAWQGFGTWGRWRGQAAMGGGRYLDLGAHLVDQTCQLFPQEIESVYCRMHHDDPDTDVETEALLVITFEGGRTGVCDMSSRAAISKPRFYVKGRDATFVKYGLDPQEAAMKAGDIDAATEDQALFGTLKGNGDEQVIPTIPGRWRNYYENVAEVIRNGAEPVVKPQEMRRVMAVLDAGMRSAMEGRVVGKNEGVFE